jgi:hypothetical protein
MLNEFVCEPDAETRDRCRLLLVMWSEHVHRVYAPRRTITAQNKRDARQES